MRSNQVVLRLKEFSHTATIQHSAISFIGSFINGFLGLLYFFYLARVLNPDNFGRFSLAVGLISIGFSIFNLGLDPAIIKYKNNPEISGNILFIKLVLSLFATILSFVIFGPAHVRSWVGLGIASQMLFSLVIATIQSQQNYYTWSAFYVGTNLFRLLVTFILSSLSPLINILIYILTPLLGFLVYIFIYPHSLPKPKFRLIHLVEFLQFNLHLSISSIFSAVSSKIDQFFIAGFQSYSQAGLYSLSSQIASSVSQLTTAYSVVIAPKFSSLDNPSKNKSYLIKNLWLSFTISLFLIPILMLLGYILFTLSGKDFFQSIPQLLLLLFGMSIFFTSVPLRDSLLYYYGNSKIFSVLSVFQLILSVLSGFLIIRPFGPLGAAISFLAIQVFSVVILFYYYVNQAHSPHHR